jgi:hypothetical protein
MRRRSSIMHGVIDDGTRPTPAADRARATAVESVTHGVHVGRILQG